MRNVNKKIIKIFILFLINILFCIFISNISNAAADFDVNAYKPDSAMIEVKGETQLQKIGLAIVGPIRVIGSFVSVLALIIIGVKYMFGSVEEKAQYKKTLLPYFWGAIMVFGITNIVSIIYDIAVSI